MQAHREILSPIGWIDFLFLSIMHRMNVYILVNKFQCIEWDQKAFTVMLQSFDSSQAGIV